MLITTLYDSIYVRLSREHSKKAACLSKDEGFSPNRIHACSSAHAIKCTCVTYIYDQETISNRLLYYC